ncbi:RNA-binding domain-containing protein [uncultured Acetobacterium sp.]|uniref:RNA-binding domain-containing protein n=1 Tax=uncultured Acetobacterium sp. TaxID=217139 RepID=UPI003450AD92
MKKESRELEYKQEYTPTFLKTVSAFSNYLDGEIIFGIEDNGNIRGIKKPELMKLSIENAINDNIHPRPIFRISEKELEGKTLIVLKVQKGNETPYYYRHQAYQRSDTSSVPVDDKALRNLVMEGNHISYEQLPAQKQDLEFHVLENALRNEIGIEKFDYDVLRTLGLYKDGRYNRAAELLADQNEIAESTIDMVRFGDTESIFLDRKSITKETLLIQYDEALKFFDHWYQPYEEVVGFYREKRIQVPRAAFRESLANAIVHRDFTINAAIRIGMYKDHIEITSPGALPSGLTKEDFTCGDVSVLRNSIIAEVFHRLNIIEKFATGIRRIKKEYASFEESAAFEVHKTYIKFTLPCVSYKEEGRTENIEDFVVAIIKKQGSITRAEMESITGLKKSRVSEVLKTLTNKGVIQKTGKARGTKYILAD